MRVSDWVWLAALVVAVQGLWFLGRETLLPRQPPWPKRTAWLVWPTVAATVVAATRWSWFVHPDTTIARAAADTLFSAHWTRLYELHPLAQMGPLAIAAARLPHETYVVAVALLSLVFLVLAASGGPRSEVTWRSLPWVVATLGLVVPWSQLAWKGHADDALVLVALALMLSALERRRRWLLALGFVIGIAAKPTAVLALPLLGGDLVALVAALSGAALIWLPFVLGAPAGLIGAGRGVMPLVRGDLATMLGLAPGRPPAWWRPLLLGCGMLGTALGVLRARPEVGVLIAVTVRSLGEMNPAPAYAASVVALALYVDARRTSFVPVLTVVALGGFWTSQMALDHGIGWPRLACHLLVLLLAGRELVRGGPARAPQTSGRPLFRRR